MITIAVCLHGFNTPCNPNHIPPDSKEPIKTQIGKHIILNTYTTADPHSYTSTTAPCGHSSDLQNKSSLFPSLLFVPQTTTFQLSIHIKPPSDCPRRQYHATARSGDNNEIAKTLVGRDGMGWEGMGWHFLLVLSL